MKRLYVKGKQYQILKSSEGKHFARGKLYLYDLVHLSEDNNSMSNVRPVVDFNLELKQVFNIIRWYTE
jgi:hypothetical protein